VDWLGEALSHGPRLVKELEEGAENRGGITKGTPKRARLSTQVEAFRSKIPGPWWLRLPDTGKVCGGEVPP
jgi:hypothetical protein